MYSRVKCILVFGQKLPRKDDNGYLNPYLAVNRTLERPIGISAKGLTHIFCEKFEISTIDVVL